jgi:peptide-methionine (S)-S-oxide reductase
MTSMQRRMRAAVSLLAVGALALAAALALRMAPLAAEGGRPIPAPVTDDVAGQRTTAVAVFAGGCFWGVQGVFQHVQGVTSAVSGYAGGSKHLAHYQVVSLGATSHAESVQVTFDPRVISYGRLLQIYFSVAHDPTQLNRQGPDSGPQYRSTIFPADADQARIARAYVDQLHQAKVFPKKIVTTFEANQTFYPAENYHQNYLVNNPTAAYIAIHDLPKVADLKRLFPEVYRTEPVLVDVKK